MKYLSLLLTVFSLLILEKAQAQISTLPYTEDFNRNFVRGENVEFIPNWLGNEVEAERRIFRANGPGNNPALGIIPTSAFEADIQIRVNALIHRNLKVSFKAKSEKNGEGNRSASLFVETSIDGGISWITEKLLANFPNETQSNYSEYSYFLPGAADNRASVVIRIKTQRSNSGNSTSPKILLDDFKLEALAQDLTPPEIISTTVVDERTIQIRFNEAVSTSAQTLSNYSGVANLTSAVRSANNQTVTLKFNPDFGIGVFNNMTIQNITDLNGNTLLNPYTFEFVYNPNTPNLIFTEIMYNPPETETDSLEFLEIYNRGSAAAQLGGLYFSDGIEFVFPTYSLAPGAYYLVAVNKSAAESQYGKTFTQWTSGMLNNAGEALIFRNSKGEKIDSVSYQPAWGGDGNGRSIVRCDLTDLLSAQERWSQSNSPSGGIINGFQVYTHPGERCPLDVSSEIRFENNILRVMEDEGSISAKLLLIYRGSSTSTVQVNIDPSSTAIRGVDFNTSSNFPLTLSFSNFNTSRTIDISLINNGVVSGEKKLILKLSNPTNALIGGNGQLSIDIIDDDIAQQICVNELMSSNASYAQDEFEEFDDWFELHNPSNFPIDIGGFYLTDNANSLQKYRIPTNDPASTTIPANGFLVFWADNQSSQGARHTNFALSSEGESIALVRPNGTTILDSVNFPAIATDISYGRREDCGNRWIVFGKPTLGFSNLNTAIVENFAGRKLIAYPNPISSGRLNFNEPLTFELFDTFGRRIGIHQQEPSLDVNSLSNGMYFIRTHQGEILRFIVNR